MNQTASSLFTPLPDTPRRKRQKGEGGGGGGTPKPKRRQKFLGLPSLTKTTRLQLFRPYRSNKKRSGYNPPRLRLRFSEFHPLPEKTFTQAKSQLKATRRAARQLRTFDAKEHAAARHMFHHDDMSDRRPSQRYEAEKEARRRAQRLRRPDDPNL